MKKTIIGLTGPTGAGKTQSSAFLAELPNVKVIDCDEISKTLRETNEEMKAELRAEFGTVYADELAGVVFTDSDKRQALNTITHKYILDEIDNQIEASDKEIIIVDGALLIESNFVKKCHAIIAIMAPIAARVKHIMERDNLSLTQAVARMSAQADDKFYTQNATEVVINDSDLKQLKERIIGVFNHLVPPHEVEKKAFIPSAKSLLGTAIYAGTFSPPTVGHLDVIKRAAESYSKLYVLVADNPAKVPEFSTNERVEMLKKLTKNMSNVEIDYSHDLIAEYAHNVCAEISIRGIRNDMDLANENEQNYFNRQIALDNGWEPLKPVFLPTSHDNFYVSSKNIRIMLRKKSSQTTAKRYIPEEIWEDVIKKYENK